MSWLQRLCDLVRGLQLRAKEARRYRAVRDTVQIIDLKLRLRSLICLFNLCRIPDGPRNGVGDLIIFVYFTIMLHHTCETIFIPHATSCGEYNVLDPSVSQSVSQFVSPVFLVSATPLKPLNRISGNFVVMKDIPC